MRRKVLIQFFVGLLVFTAVFLAIFAINRSTKDNLQKKLVNDFAGQESTIAREVATSVTDRFKGIENTLTAIALDPKIQNPDKTICNPALKNYYDSVNIGIGNLGRVNSDGLFYCTLNPKLLGTPASKLGTYVKKLFDDPKHHTVVSPEVSVPGVDGYVAALHVPVYNSQHKFIGTIGGAVYLKQLARELFSSVKFAKTGFVSVQDDNGDIIQSIIAKNIGKNYFSPYIQNQPGLKVAELSKGILSAREGRSQIVSYVGIGGVEKIAAVEPVTIAPGHRWIIIVSVPKREIANTFFSAGLNSAFDTVLVVAGIALLSVLGFVLFVSYSSYRLQKIKDQFISLVSHQLRTPLTSMRLFSEMLTDPKVGALNPKQKEYVGNIHLSTVRMIQLVGSILNVSRIDLNRLKVAPEPTNINEFLESQIIEIQPLADEKKVLVKTNLPSQTINLSVDQILLGQVIHNLLTNAIRYTAEVNGHVQIDLLKAKKGGCEIIVTDNGIGVPKNARKHIFKQFYRAENAIHVVGDGTGLGLYLVKRILTTTGGNVWFEDARSGSGTAFHATIPNTGMKAKS